MKKAEFIELVAEKAEMSKTAATRVVDAIFNTASGAITEAVDAAGHLSIPGFGKFTRRTRAARTGRNPRTGAMIDIPERTSVAFTPGRGLRNLSSAGEGGGKRTTKKSTAKKTSAKKTAATQSVGGKKGTAAAKGEKKGNRQGAGAARAQKSK